MPSDQQRLLINLTIHIGTRDHEYVIIKTLNLVSFISHYQINTWLIILKRHVKAMLIEVLFYLTWVIFRLLLYPYLIPKYWGYYHEDSKEFGTHWNVVLLAPLIQMYLTGLNFWWTITMLKQLLIGSKRKKDESQINTAVISSANDKRDLHQE